MIDIEVAPYVGAWIEISAQLMQVLYTHRRPLRRGVD